MATGSTGRQLNKNSEIENSSILGEEAWVVARGLCNDEILKGYDTESTSRANNFMAWVKGPCADYDDWAKLVEDPWWRWENVKHTLNKVIVLYHCPSPQCQENLFVTIEARRLQATVSARDEKICHSNTWSSRNRRVRPTQVCLTIESGY